MRKKVILFVCYGGGHVAMLYPVIDRLKDKYGTVVLALTTAQAYLRARGIPFIGYKDFPEAQNLEVSKLGSVLSAELPINNLVAKEETIAYLGINFCELVETYGLKTAKILYQQKGRRVFLPIKTMERFLKRLSPDIVVATNSPRTEQAVFLAARNLNIPSVCLIDLFAFQEIQWIGQSGYAKKLCVLNNFVKEDFIKAGRSPEEIVVTGNPAFDALQEEDILQASINLKKDKRWNDGKINILWASQPELQQHPFYSKTGSPSLLDRIENVLRDFVKDNPNFRLIVRYHPSENKNFIHEKNVEFSPCSNPIEPLIHAVDLVIVTASTVGLQAHIIGKPVISVDSTIWVDDVKYAQQGISVGVKSPEELPDAIRNCKAFFKGKGVPQYSKNATQNVINVIENVLHE